MIRGTHDPKQWVSMILLFLLQRHRFRILHFWALAAGINIVNIRREKRSAPESAHQQECVPFTEETGRGEDDEEEPRAMIVPRRVA